MFPLNSAQLSRLATTLIDAADTIDTNTHRADARWAEAFGAGLSGISFSAGHAAEQRIMGALTGNAATIRSAATILKQAADAQALLDGFATYALPIAEHALEDNALVSLMTTKLGMQARALDIATAQALRLLGADTTQPQHCTLGERAGMSAADIHTHNAAALTPEADAALDSFMAQRSADDPPVHVLEVGPGRLVVAVGDIDTADSITTVVAGVHSSDPGTWATYLERTAAVQQATKGAAVMWLGYDAPPSVPHAANHGPAREAAPHLREFQRALRERGASRSTGDDPRLLVLGHSYGSRVVGEAATWEPLEADRVVLAGSPGTGVWHESQLKLSASDGDAEIYAVTGTRDYIGLVGSALGGYHGTDPTDSTFGAITWPSTSGHDYWRDPTFLARLGEAANSG